MSVLLTILLLMALAGDTAPPIRQPADQAPLTVIELHSLRERLASDHLSPQWIEIDRWNGFGASGLSAHLFLSAIKSSQDVCRIEALTYFQDGETWRPLGEPEKYVVLSRRDARYCGSAQASGDRIVLQDELGDATIVAVVAAIRDGRVKQDSKTESVAGPDGVMTTLSVPSFMLIDRKNRIDSIKVEKDGSVDVQTSRRPGAGQNLHLRKTGAHWFVDDVSEWVA